MYLLLMGTYGRASEDLTLRKPKTASKGVGEEGCYSLSPNKKDFGVSSTLEELDARLVQPSDSKQGCTFKLAADQNGRGLDLKVIIFK